MKQIYIISRYRAATEKEREFNRNVARYFCKQIIQEGDEPVAPHLYFTQFLDDDYEDEREKGLSFANKKLFEADEFLLVVIDGVLSQGMRGEIAKVGEWGMRGRIVSLTHSEIKEAMKVVR